MAARSDPAASRSLSVVDGRNGDALADLSDPALRS
jgi:hypothetical protein